TRENPLRQSFGIARRAFALRASDHLSQFRAVLLVKNIPHKGVFRGCPIFGIFFDSCLAEQDKEIDMRCCLSEASLSNDYENRTSGP
ncbi:MAG: hypothetical protein IK075_06615, partial [Prevotella sp.]|nr:hypothetical protein [Prevotella sp.]